METVLTCVHECLPLFLSDPSRLLTINPTVSGGRPYGAAKQEDISHLQTSAGVVKPLKRKRIVVAAVAPPVESTSRRRLLILILLLLLMIMRAMRLVLLRDVLRMVEVAQRRHGHRRIAEAEA
ncbi:unnamed protein product [Musa acuminata subsp. burmannicoides]